MSFLASDLVTILHTNERIDSSVGVLVAFSGSGEIGEKQSTFDCKHETIGEHRPRQ